ncbi:MAG: hypothetical protein NVV74_03320 [Magnetospirillum sp.]|nr:hypothetical protein [Magnetospirillum sp.]
MSPSPIASRLPGRLRLRHPALRRSPANRHLCDELGGWDGVTSAEGNPATGGVLLRYDPVQVEPAAMEARVETRLAELFDAPPAKAAAPGGAGLDMRRLNRAAKVGMLTSLTASLLALAVGKRLHAAFGAAHLAFLLVHLAHHRRKMLQ